MEKISLYSTFYTILQSKPPILLRAGRHVQSGIFQGGYDNNDASVLRQISDPKLEFRTPG